MFFISNQQFVFHFVNVKNSSVWDKTTRQGLSMGDPRPSPLSVNDHFDPGGREGSLIKKTSLKSFLVVSAPSAGVSNVCEAKNIPLLFENKEHVREIPSLDGDPPPLDTDVNHVIKWTRPSPSVFAYYNRSKNWTVGRPGNETRPTQQNYLVKVSCYSSFKVR